MKLYTNQGNDDAWTCSAAFSRRVYKDHWIIEIYGTIDELSTLLDIVKTQKSFSKKKAALLTTIQQELYEIGSHLLSKKPAITAEKIKSLELQIHAWTQKLPKLNHFLFSSTTLASAYCQLARCICRKLERRLVTLHRKRKFSPLILAYINRLSDWLFILARTLDASRKR